MTTNIVTAVFGAFKVTRTRQLYQYDYGQILRFKGIELPATYTVHFANRQIGGDAVKQVGDADGVKIPDAMLTSGQNVYAWVFLHTGADDGETMYAVTIPVQQRPRPTEEEPTPVHVAANAVNFRDFNGAIVAAYSAADFAALTALPANPSHDGLTAQGWNWTLAKAQAYVAKYGRLEIGQMYITDDGTTRIYIHLEQGRTSPMLGCCPNGTVDVDWGDGSAHDTLTGTDETAVQWTPNHAYAASGDYVIKLTVTGSIGFYGRGSNNEYSGLLRYTSSGDGRNHAYQNAIKKIEIGSSVTRIGEFAFRNCNSLASVTIPDSIIGISNTAFHSCYSLTSITISRGIATNVSLAFNGCNSLASVAIPDNATSIGYDAFQYCYSLANITIPDSVTSINAYAFQDCYNLAIVNIPDGVTSINDYAFRNCYSVAEYHLAPTTPPTLDNTNVFIGIPADCIIYVPYSADHSILNAYKSANNWSSYASKMQEEAA